jgi:hypothetical protein
VKNAREEEEKRKAIQNKNKIKEILEDPKKSTNISNIMEAAETPVPQNVYKTFQLKKFINSNTSKTSTNLSTAKSEKSNFGKKAFIGRYSSADKKPLFGQAEAQ